MQSTFQGFSMKEQTSSQGTCTTHQIGDWIQQCSRNSSGGGDHAQLICLLHVHHPQHSAAEVLAFAQICMEAFNALAQDWKGEKPYAFPPFILIGRFLQKLKQDNVKEAILIAPVWPYQVWYPQLLDCLIDFPLTLQSNRPLLTNSLNFFLNQGSFSCNQYNTSYYLLCV